MKTPKALPEKRKSNSKKQAIAFLKNLPTRKFKPAWKPMLATLVSGSYSVRPKPGATVSMPLHWEEVKKGLKMSDFTLRNAVARIQSEGALFRPVLGRGIDLKKVLKKMEEMQGSEH